MNKKDFFIFLVLIFFIISVFECLNSFISSFFTKEINLPETNISEIIQKNCDKNYPIKLHPKGYNVFELVENITGIDQKILTGYADTEGHWDLHAIGDSGRSKGLMQINETYRNQRIRLCGYEYDPFDLFDSVYLAGLIIKENQKAFPGNQDLWITAYCRGIEGTRKKGALKWYVKKVTEFL